MLGYQLIADTTVSGSAATSVNFTGLNITKDDDYMLVSDYMPSATGQIRFFANNNTTLTNYWKQYLYASSTSVSSERGNDSDIASMGTGQRLFNIISIKLTNSGYITYQSKVSQSYAGGAGINLVNYYGSSTFTATSITQITITAQTAGTIGIGSRFQLYKCVAEKVADITVGTATTSVDITGLSIDKTSEYMLVSDVVNAGTGCDYYLYANANTTATNYYNQSISVNSSTTTPVRVNNATITNVATSAKNCIITNIKLTNNGYFVTQSSAIATYGGASVYLLNKNSTSTFTATSITQLTITSATATQIAVGSRFQLYKMK